MRAVITSVDYGDLLSVTLPFAAPHFERIVVATTPEDAETAEVARRFPNVVLHRTVVFHERGAALNKGAALEESFDVMGREGWFVVLDADIVLPRAMPFPPLEVGKLYSPLRRMMPIGPGPLVIPPEGRWADFPIHRNLAEWAGYFQLAHAEDPVLRERPWYPTEFSHAGTIDSLYQAKWERQNKVRPGFEVLHVGEPGVNWAGRSSARLDGTRHPDADARAARVRAYVRQRRRQPPHDRFGHERL